MHPLHYSLDMGHRILSRLATGGMAEVFLAESATVDGFHKRLVLKRIKPELAANPFFVEMFLDEARLNAQLSHPNIGQIFDFGMEDDRPYFTMEFIDGPDVLTLLRTLSQHGQRVPLAEALTIVVAAARGLHHAHERRAVHRDVSPSNLLISYTGDVKVIDFGVAKASDQQNQTRIGMLKGKYAYMSPEQCRGAPVDRRSDVFALGILLFELTTGTRLFRGQTELDTINRILSSPVPRPSERRTDYPAVLESIVLRALARDPGDRYSTAEALMEAIISFARMNELELSPLKLATLVRRVVPPKAVAGAFEVDPPTLLRKKEASVIVEEALLVDASPRVMTPRPSRLSRRALAGVAMATIGLLATCGIALAALRRRPLPPPPAPIVAAAAASTIPRRPLPKWLHEPTERTPIKARRRH